MSLTKSQHDQGYTDNTKQGTDHQQTFACARNMDCHDRQNSGVSKA